VVGYGQIYNILSGGLTNRRQYEITIGKFPTCICLDFVGMVANSLGRSMKRVPCKHLYYVLQHVMFFEEFKNFIHFPPWSCDGVCHLLDHDSTYK
jgi:hypothetical protein